MSAWTLAQAKESLEIWMAAEKAIATGQSYQIGSRILTRANLSEVAERLSYWRNEVERLTSGRSGARVMRIIPRD